MVYGSTWPVVVDDYNDFPPVVKPIGSKEITRVLARKGLIPGILSPQSLNGHLKHGDTLEADAAQVAKTFEVHRNAVTAADSRVAPVTLHTQRT